MEAAIIGKTSAVVKTSAFSLAHRINKLLHMYDISGHRLPGARLLEVEKQAGQ